MRKFVLTAAAASAALGLAAPAFAQDASQGSGSVPFSGLHVEALGGFDHIGSDAQTSGSNNGFVYGGAVGYDDRIGNIVLGVDGEIDGSTASTTDHNVLTAGDQLHLSAGRDLYAGARVGYVVTPKTMVYAKAGYTNARVDGTYDLGAASFLQHQDLSGYRVGAGVERNLTQAVYIKAEYRYSHYQDIKSFDVQPDRQQVLAGVGFRF
jgi:outer membrane immunogenic protein